MINPDEVVVRDATAADAEHCARIYAPYVRDTAITFEIEPPGPDVMRGRIAAAQSGHVWLVAAVSDAVVGYAYATAFKERPAYRWACETTVYVSPEAHGAGVGTALYKGLLARLGTRGYLRAVAVITLPNVASVALHRRMGFTDAGVLRRVGWKAGAWHDVAWMQRDLGTPGGDMQPPAEPA